MRLDTWFKRIGDVSEYDSDVRWNVRADTFVRNRATNDLVGRATVRVLIEQHNGLCHATVEKGSVPPDVLERIKDAVFEEPSGGFTFTDVGEVTWRTAWRGRREL